MDLCCDIHWLYKHKLWLLSYIDHVIAVYILGVLTQNHHPSIAYFFGIMSHPIQDWLVNAFAHSKGYRNFDTPDKSVNNLLLGWLVFGEGY